MYDKYFLMSEPDIEGYIRENLPEYFAADEKLVCKEIGDDKSEGGYAYESYEEFKNALYNLEHDVIKNRNMGNNGLRYVNANYDWDDICNKLMYIINTISH